MQGLLGYKPSGMKAPAYHPPQMPLPTNFSSATNWPKCTVIAHIWNQAKSVPKLHVPNYDTNFLIDTRCGSCWAFGGVAAASDRFCIATNGAFNEGLSFAQVTECTSGGCDGGSAEDTWSFIQYTGIVTGTYNHMFCINEPHFLISLRCLLPLLYPDVRPSATTLVREKISRLNFNADFFLIND